MPYPKIVFYLLFIQFSLISYNQSYNPFPVREGGLYYYINEQGEKISSTSFLYANFFYEGLACVRTEQGYGYINEQGIFEITPQFGFAQSFKNGLAIVYYQNGNPTFIDKQGKPLSQLNYVSIQPFKNNRSIVKTESGKVGAINRKGELVIDTVFSEIHNFEGLATLAIGLNHDPRNYDHSLRKKEMTIIDSSGKKMIAYNLNYTIRKYHNGYFKFHSPEDTLKKQDYFEGLLNVKGQVIFKSPNIKGVSIQQILPNKQISVFFSNCYWNNETKSLQPFHSSSQGLMNLKGEIVSCDTNISYISNFKNKRELVRRNDWTYLILDENYTIIPSQPITRVYDNGFKNGKARVEINNEVVFINDNGKIIHEEGAHDISKNTRIYRNNKFYTLKDKNNNEFVSRVIQYNIINDYHDLIICSIDSGGITRNKLFAGTKLIWTSPISIDKDSLKKINTPFHTRASFYASSTPSKSDIGGFGGSSNKSVQYNENDNRKELFFKIDTTLKSSSNGYARYSFQLINNTTKKVKFEAQDSRLEMLIEVLDSDGKRFNINHPVGAEIVITSFI